MTKEWFSEANAYETAKNAEDLIMIYLSPMTELALKDFNRWQKAFGKNSIPFNSEENDVVSIVNEILTTTAYMYLPTKPVSQTNTTKKELKKFPTDVRTRIRHAINTYFLKIAKQAKLDTQYLRALEREKYPNKNALNRAEEIALNNTPRIVARDKIVLKLNLGLTLRPYEVKFIVRLLDNLTKQPANKYYNTLLSRFNAETPEQLMDIILQSINNNEPLYASDIAPIFQQSDAAIGYVLKNAKNKLAKVLKNINPSTAK